MVELKYRKAFDTLKREILSGKYTSRKSFPSLVAACARFGISRLTAVKAFDKLKEEGLMKTLGSLGYKVPDDVLVAGFDDVRVARLSSPGITTIHQPCEGIARAVFDRLVARMLCRTIMPAHILLPYTLVVRGSTGGGIRIRCRRRKRK